MRKKTLFNGLLLFAALCVFDYVKGQPCPTCPPPIVVDAAPGLCGANISYPSMSPCGPLTPAPGTPCSGCLFPVGTTTVTLLTPVGSRCSFTVTVNDRQGPVITNLAAVPNSLWPPNHKMNDVAVNYNVSDNCGLPVSCGLSVVSNEPVNSTGDGNTAPDWIVLDNRHVQLRAERKGNNDGRIYTIAVTCTDKYGNPSVSTTRVVVPHDMSSKGRSENGLGGDMMPQQLQKALLVKVLRNPSNSYFSLDVETANNRDKIEIKLFDLSGKLMERKNNLSAGQVINIGSNLRPGTYLAEVKQGSEVSRVKLVKQ